MVKDQLFKKYPTNELYENIINSFGIYDIDNKHTFSRNDLKHLKTVEKINKLKPYLEKCYIPCKGRTYLNNLTEKNVITVLRQILKIRGYHVSSREKYIKGHKYILYKVEKNEEKVYKPLNDSKPESLIKNDKPIIITFN
jgi:hypothetical protein|tara:strand:- start:605 stop:1024 length:420 start_codon:yes stop_codon:yes gene_type:complete